MIHHIFANRSNIGDWLSAKGIQSLLGLPVTEHLCDEPFIDKTIAELSLLTPEDAIIIGGGGLLMDYFTPFWERFLFIAKSIPFFIWGVGSCDLRLQNSIPPVALIEEIFSRARLCFVRDELTHSFLKKLHLPAPVACPSMAALRGEPLDTGLLHVDNFTTVGDAVYAEMDRVCEAYAQKNGRIFRKTNNRIETGRENALQAVLYRYVKSEIVVSSALHGCIIGLAMGRKVIAVSGDRKIDSFMNAAGMGAWLCTLDEVAKLPGLLDKVQEQIPPSEFIAQTVKRNAAIADQIKKSMAGGAHGKSFV